CGLRSLKPFSMLKKMKGLCSMPKSCHCSIENDGLPCSNRAMIGFKRPLGAAPPCCAKELTDNAAHAATAKPVAQASRFDGAFTRRVVVVIAPPSPVL